MEYVGDDEKVWIPIFEQRLNDQKLVDVINTSHFLGQRNIVLPRAVAATTALLGREPRSYSDYVASRVDRPRAEHPGQDHVVEATA